MAWGRLVWPRGANAGPVAAVSAAAAIATVAAEDCHTQKSVRNCSVEKRTGQLHEVTALPSENW